MANKFRPIRENRSISIERLWKKVHKDPAFIRADLECSRRSAQKYLDEKRPWGTSMNSLNTQADETLYLGLMLHCMDSEGVLEALSSSATLTHFAVSTMSRIQVKARQSVAPGTGHFDKYVIWQSLALRTGLAHLAEQFAPFIESMLQGENYKQHGIYYADADASRFYLQLQAILIKRRWPATSETAGLGRFAPLFDAAQDPVRFRAVLLDYCDMRTAHAFCYPSIDIDIRVPLSRFPSIFADGFPFLPIIPFELWTFQHAYQCATGKALSLDCDHPLMHSEWVTRPFPQVTFPYLDAVFVQSRPRVDAYIGSDWDPSVPLPGVNW